MGFVHPGAWLLAALFGVLIALYLWERARRRIDVPSLLLWQAIPETIVHRTRFQPDWLFVLQCVLLALLIAGLADPYFSSPSGGAIPRRSVFVLDCSASMQAREGRTTRFDMARDLLQQRLEALNPDDEAMIIGAAHQPIVVAPFSRDRDDLRRRLAELEPVDTRANLDAALAVAQRAAAGTDRSTTIELFTDTPHAQLATAWRDGIGVVQLGETDDNLAIEGVQVFQGRFQDHRDAHAYVAVRNFAHREAHGVLTLQLDDTVFSRQGFSLAPRSAGGFPLAAVPDAGVLRATLEVDDALAADNHAAAYVRPVRPIRVLVVSDDASLRRQLDRIAAATANLRFDYIAAEAYAGAANGDVVLFHRVAPPAPADVASMYVFPPAAEDGPFAVRGEVERLRLVDWNSQHPVLRGLRLELPFAIEAVRVVDPPAWADTLLGARAADRDVALAFAGEPDGQRRALVAFDVARADLLAADHVNLLLFFLNLIDWLAPADTSVRIVHTGDVEIIDDLPPRPRRVVDPRRRQTTVAADSPVTIDAAYAGEYRIAANGTGVRVFANFADSEESDIGRAASEAVAPRPSTAAAGPASQPRGNGLWLYALATALLLLEWLAARRAA